MTVTDLDAETADLLERADAEHPAAPRLPSVRDRLRTIDELGAIEPLEPLLDGYLYRDTLAMLYGPSGSGKSMLALGWAMHLATGTWWERRTATRSRVLYVVGEGVRGIRPRVDAWLDHHRILSTDWPVHFAAGAVNLTKRIDVQDLADVAAELDVQLVVFDTLARCAVGADENSARDMGQVVDHLDIIRTATDGACVLIVHHSGKDSANGARGSSALKAAVDVEIELAATGTLKVTKAKDWAPPAAIPLAITPVGDSAVIARTDDTAAPGRTDDVLTILAETAPDEGLTATAWLDLTAEAGISKATFHRARKHLVDTGQVTRTGTDRSPRYHPAEVSNDA